MLDVDSSVRRGVSVLKEEVSILASPVRLTHFHEGTSPVVRKIESGEENKKALGEARSRNVHVIRAGIVEPGGSKDTSVHIVRKVVVVETCKPRRDRAIRCQGVVEEPVCLREREVGVV